MSGSGTLNTEKGGPSIELTDPKNSRRTIYATVHRREMSDVLLSHDFPAPTAHSPRRAQTTTALQGLYALNGPLLQSQAEALAARLNQQTTKDDERVETAYRLLFARRPTGTELEIALSFLSSPGNRNAVERWQQYAHVLLASNEFLYLQ